MKVKMVPLSYFYEWVRRSGQVNGQSKIPRVLKETPGIVGLR
jgi:hypothetical protein